MKSLILITFFFCLVKTHICHDDDCPVNRYLLILHQVNKIDYSISYMLPEICHNCQPCQVTNCTNCIYPTHCPYNLTFCDHQSIDDNQHFSQDWYYNQSIPRPTFAEQIYLTYGSCSCLDPFNYFSDASFILNIISEYNLTSSCQASYLYFRYCQHPDCNIDIYTNPYAIDPHQTPNITDLPCLDRRVGDNNDSDVEENNDSVVGNHCDSKYNRRYLILEMSFLLSVGLAIWYRKVFN